MLATLGQTPDYNKSLASRLREQFKTLGFDPCDDSFYGKNRQGKLSLANIGNIFSRMCRIANKDGFRRYCRGLQQYNRRMGTTFNVDNLTYEKCIEFANKFEVIRESVDLSGRYYAMVYFLAFHERFKLSEDTVSALRRSLLARSYDKSALMAVYNDMKSAHDAGQLECQIGVYRLFDTFNGNGSEGYTSIFN